MAFEKLKFNLKDEVKAFLFLMRELNLTQSEAQRLIARNRLICNGEIVKNSAKLISGEVEVTKFAPTPIGLKPIFQTKEFAIFDKPPFMLIHPKNTLTKNSLLDEAKAMFGDKANITHRIDYETSGLVLVAKNLEVEIELKKLFEEQKVKKSYLALVKGEIKKELFIDLAILKNDDFTNTKDRVFIDENGKSSQTIIKPIKFFKDKNVTLIEAIPLTGRLHQIRVHLHYIGHTILGEPIYGKSFEFASKYLDKILSTTERIDESGANRVMLHSNKIEFEYKKIKYKIYSIVKSSAIINTIFYQTNK